VHSGPVEVDGRTLLHSIIIDETPRVRAEAALTRRDRLYSMLSETNQRLIRARDRSTLFSDVCRVAVEYGGFRFAWVGLVAADGHVEAVARAGEDAGYINSVQATIREGDARSKGPVGRAIVTGAPVVVDDFQGDPASQPWRESAALARVQSVAAIPLREDERVIGALMLYSGEPGFFASEEVSTLLEMASDVSYGLHTLASTERRVAAEERAAKWYVRLEQYLDGSPSVSYAIRVTEQGWESEWLTANAVRLLGYSMEEMLADGWWATHVHPDDLERASAVARSVVETGGVRLEYRVRTAFGTEIWILDTSRFDPDPSGVGGRITGSWTDITDRRLAAAKLEESEERLRLALSAARQGLYDLDLTTGVAVVTPEYATMLGYDPATFHETNAAWQDRMHPLDRERVAAVYHAYVAGEIPEYRVEHRQRTRTGEWRWVLSVGSIAGRDPDGRPIRMLGTHTDITELKRTEEQLALRARTAQALMELPALSVRVSEREFFQSALEVIQRLTESELGFIHEVHEGESALELAYCSHRGPVANCQALFGTRCKVSEAGAWADAYRERRAVLCNDETACGDQRGLTREQVTLHRLISAPVIEDGAVRLLVGVANKGESYSDTEVETVQLLAEELWRLAQQRRTDLAHQRSERFRQLLLENLAEGVVAADAEGRLTLFNRVAREWHGIDADASLDPAAWSESYQLFESDGTTPLTTERIPLVRAIRGETVHEARMSIVRPGMPPRLIVANGGPLLGDDGRQIGSLMIMHDETAQRAAEAALTLRVEALDAAADAIVITDRNGVVEWANAAFTALTGYSLNDAAGHNPRTLLRSGVQSREFYAEMWKTILEGKVWRGELVNKRQDGTLYPESLTITPVRDARGEIQHFIAIKRDLTEDRSLRENLMQAQKMESVGRLAGGVAHDFNNLLTVINGSTELALGHVSEDSPAHEDLLDIRRAAERAAALTRQLLAFSRRQILRRHLVDFPGLIGDLSKMLQRLIGEDVVLRTELSGGSGRVLADAGQLEQVVMNLVVNARDAMPNGGTLTLSTTDVELDQAATGQHEDMAPGRYVRFTVRDSGIGMDESVRARIFEPFFTTKGPGQGTGLGLSTVYGIIRQSGGDVQVESAPGEGTAFHIFLPYAQADDEHASVAAPAAKPISSEASTGQLRGTVLVVDDEPVLRNLAVKILTRSGYTTLSAGDAEEAMAIFDERGGAIDLLLTDVVMPGLSGPALAKELTARRPQLKVIFASGYTDDMVLRHGVDGNTMEFLGKPYTFKELITRVEAAMAKP
jgi:PAS domain S-box-containing protein